MLQVYARRQKQRLIEIQIHAFAATNENNAEAITSLVEDYRQSLFPGLTDKKPDKMVQMRKMLEAEVNKVYVLGRDDKQSRATLDRALKSENKNLAAWAAHEVHKEDMAKRRLMKDWKAKKTRLPRGLRWADPE